MFSATSALSLASDSETAFRDVSESVAQDLGNEPATLAVLFASPHHAHALGSCAQTLLQRELSHHVMGCTAESIVGGGREIESGPALALWAIRMPGTQIRPFRATGLETLNELSINPQGGPDPTRLMLLLGDPYSFPSEDWLNQTNEHHPGLPVIGGMASGASAPGQNRLVINDQVASDGAIGVLINGSVSVTSVVSQGCRPVGRPMIVTRVDQNVVLELGRRPAVEVLKEMLESLPPDDLQRVRAGLHLGRVMSEYQDSFQRGDFLVRNILGLDPRGGVATTDLIRVGQTVQFHVRDAESAEEDFRELLINLNAEKPVAGLLFTCNGRGSRLFSHPDNDVSTIRELLGPIPVSGFFAMGELGPVGGRNFVHGFTASLALFKNIDD